MYYSIKKFLGIRSKNHEFVTYESSKRFLSDFDDGINTLAYGHKNIPKDK